MPRAALKLWLDCGKYEWLLDGNRQMHALLEARAYPHTYHEFSGGHNYTCWSHQLPRALETLFGT
jgi:enterochelin esterase family protein